MFILLLLAAQINLNKAPLEEIYKLPVDSVIARRIYEHRELYGNFKSIYDLRKIPGIDAELFEKIKPLIKIIVAFPPRTEWGSILHEQKKLAREEPPSKATIDEWEDLLRSPIYINTATFDDLVMIDRMTPVDAAAIMKRLQLRTIKSTRDLVKVNGLSHYAYTSLRRYVQFRKEPVIKKPVGSLRIALGNINRLDTGEDENIATRIAYLESALNEFSSTAMNLKSINGWTDGECSILRQNLLVKLDTLKIIYPEPDINARLKMNYQKKLRAGFFYNKNDNFYKGYIGLSNLGLVDRFYLGNFRVVWGEGLMIDNSDEYRARIYSRSVGIFGDLTENYGYDLFGAAGTFKFSLLTDNKFGGLRIKPSFFYSTNGRDGLVNPDQSVWRIYENPTRFSLSKNKLNEESYGVNINISPSEKFNPGTQLGIEALRIDYDKELNPDVKWIDLPFDKYDASMYPEITQLCHDSMRIFYGTTFLIPLANVFISGEVVRQQDKSDPAYAFLVKGRVQYDYFYLNLLFRHYDVHFDNPFHRGFSEYRRFEDTPFEKPYALVDPEYTTIYDDPTPKPEQGIYLETRYQITRNLILTRAYIDLFKNLSHGLVNQRGYCEAEFQPIWPVRIRFSQKFIRKYLPKPILPTLSKTNESTVRVFFSLSNYDALRFEGRFGNIDLTASAGDDLILHGAFLAASYEHNFLPTFSVEGGLAIWSTDGMSQWIFEDVGIDFLSGYGMKYYVVTTQKIGNLLMRLKFRQKFTSLPHTGLYNDPDIYYPSLPGARVYDFINNENSAKINLQMDYGF